MKKVVLLSMVVLLIIFGTIAFAGGIKIFRWEASTWASVTNKALAAATGTGVFTFSGFPNSFTYDGGTYIPLPGTPTWTQAGTITWNVSISQWVFVYIGNTNFDIHVDMPGTYTVDDLQVHIISNAKVYAYFASGGDLNDGSGDTLPTYLTYETDQDTKPSAPWTGNWTSINSLPSESNYLTVEGNKNPCGGMDVTYYIWFGFEVDLFAQKGQYTTYVTTYLMGDP